MGSQLSQHTCVPLSLAFCAGGLLVTVSHGLASNVSSPLCTRLTDAAHKLNNRTFNCQQTARVHAAWLTVLLEFTKVRLLSAGKNFAKSPKGFVVWIMNFV